MKSYKQLLQSSKYAPTKLTIPVAFWADWIADHGTNWSKARFTKTSNGSVVTVGVSSKLAAEKDRQIAQLQLAAWFFDYLDWQQSKLHKFSGMTNKAKEYESQMQKLQTANAKMQKQLQESIAANDLATSNLAEAKSIADSLRSELAAKEQTLLQQAAEHKDEIAELEAELIKALSNNETAQLAELVLQIRQLIKAWPGVKGKKLQATLLAVGIGKKQKSATA